jgi:hypothetical protein
MFKPLPYISNKIEISTNTNQRNKPMSNKLNTYFNLFCNKYEPSLRNEFEIHYQFKDDNNSTPLLNKYLEKSNTTNVSYEDIKDTQFYRNITPTKKKNETKHSYNLYIFFTKFETIFSSNSLMMFGYISIDSSIDYSINIIIEKKDL